MSARLAAALADRYRIERELGGTVVRGDSLIGPTVPSTVTASVSPATNTGNVAVKQLTLFGVRDYRALAVRLNYHCVTAGGVSDDVAPLDSIVGTATIDSVAYLRLTILDSLT